MHLRFVRRECEVLCRVITMGLSALVINFHCKSESVGALLRFFFTHGKSKMAAR